MSTIPSKDQQIEALWWLLTARGYNKSFHEPGQQDVERRMIVSANDYGIQFAQPAKHSVVHFRAPTQEEVLSQVIAYRIAERLDER